MTQWLRCDCVNIKHVRPRRCDKNAAVRCAKCGDALCGSCANNHHAHREHVPLTEPANRGGDRMDTWGDVG